MIEASFYRRLGPAGAVACDLCPLACRVGAGDVGRCGVRRNLGGILYASNYQEIVRLGWGRIEEHHLYHFRPGCRVMFLASAGEALQWEFLGEVPGEAPAVPSRWVTASEVVDHAVGRGCGVIVTGGGDPFVWYEFLVELLEGADRSGIAVALRTRGAVNPGPLAALLPRLSAVNLTLLGDSGVRRDDPCRIVPLETAARLHGRVHLELTYPVVSEVNSTPDCLRACARWIAEHLGVETPLHLTGAVREGLHPAPLASPEDLAGAYRVFQESLCNVYLHDGNGADSRTTCPGCGGEILRRSGGRVHLSGILRGGHCVTCGRNGGISW